MEKFLKLASKKRKDFKLKSCDENETEESLKSILKQGVINVNGKEDMLRVAIKPDGNCQFRASSQNQAQKEGRRAVSSKRRKFLKRKCPGVIFSRTSCGGNVDFQYFL
jgi:hypothetical protein